MDSERLTLAAVEAAAERIRPWAVTTPLLSSAELDRRCGARVLVKAEVLQRTGAFKFRGAFNRLAQLSPAQRARGVVAYSSGNHAQAVAAAARLVGAPAVIVMPADAPAVKLARTRREGAEIVLYDRLRDDREAIGAALARERGLTLVPPYEDWDVMAGQGTVGLELCRQAADLSAALDEIRIPCGGGGLTAGIATTVSALSPNTRLTVVEPAGFDDTGRSLRAGERIGVEPGQTSICDALLAPAPGERTFSVNRRLVSSGIAVDDAEVRAAMAFAFAELRLVVEPGGAVALASVLANPAGTSGMTVAVVLSGGNVDPAQFAEALSVAGG